MSFSNTLSAVLRGRWLIDKSFAESQVPMVMRMINGEHVEFTSFTEYPEPVLIMAASDCASAGVYGVSPGTSLQDLPQNSMAVVTLEGPLMKRAGMCSGPGMTDHAALINQLAANPNIRGIIVNIDSPGGQADGTALLAGAIKDAGTKKPVLAIIDDGMAASAAMWIASAASEIYVTQPTDQVGSIGVYTTVADYAKQAKELYKLDIKHVYAPQSTDKNKHYQDAIDGDTTGLEEELRVLADQFINTVATNRAGKIKGDAWKTGKMFYANDAKKIGLIDGIKSFSQVVSRMENLITNNQKSKKAMAFDKTMAAAGAESFAVVDEGFALTEEQMNNVEERLATAETLQVELNEATVQANTLQEELNEANALNGAHEATIAGLQQQLATLGKQESGAGTVLVAEKDEREEDKKPVPSYLDENNPINQFADSRIRNKK